MRYAKGIAGAALGMLWGSWGLAAPGIVTDGSLGPVQTLTGPNFAVTPNLGQQRGGNLFQSFSQLNLSAGQTATFSGPAGVQNVLTRVTGGSPSQIDGTLRCTIPNANFYLMNPAGVVFGPNASLDVKGSFAVTTADVIKLSDGGQFNAAHPSDSVLTTAAPAAFGFLSAHPTGINVNGPVLAVNSAKVLSIVGGDVQFSGADVRTTDGRINIVSVGSTGTATLDPSDVHSVPQLQSFAALGNVTVADGTTLITDGDGGGAVCFRAGNLTLTDSAISAVGSGAGDGLGIDLVLSGAFNLVDSSIFTDAAGTGRAGPIAVTATSVSLDGAADTNFFSGLSALAGGDGSRGGDIHVTATSLSVLKAASITAQTLGTGVAGSVTVNAHNLLVDGKNLNFFTRITAGSQGAAHGGKGGPVAVAADTVQLTGGGQIDSDTSGDGPAGTVAIQASNISLQSGVISASTFGAGPAGSVAITADQLTVNSSPGQLTSQLAANSVKIGSGGDAGTLQINATQTTVGGTGLISVESDGRGNAGTVHLVSDSLTLDGRGVATAGISAASLAAGPGFQIGQATQAGNAGIIDIQAPTIQLSRGALINASTAGPGNGGHVTVIGTNLLIDAASTGQVTGIFADSGKPPDGNANPPAGFTPSGSAGTVQIDARSIDVLGGGIVSASTFGLGNGGQIAVNATDLLIDGRGATGINGIAADTTARLSGGSAGAINVTTTNLQILGGGSISATTSGLGHGGNVTVNVNQALKIDGQNSGSQTGILADAESSGDAGAVTVTANGLQILNGGRIAATTNAQGHGGDVMVTASTSLTIDGNGLGGGTGIFANSQSTGAGGDAGIVQVSTGTLLVRNVGRIGSDTDGAGAGGDVTVTAQTITLDDAPVHEFTGISALSLSAGAGGHGGAVMVNADTLNVTGGARISSETFGLGDGGKIDIAAKTVNLDSSTIQAGAGIIADTRSETAGGHAGGITVSADSLRITGGAIISSSTFGQGLGGNVMLTAPNLTLDGAGTSNFTGVQVTSENSGPGGRAGDAKITAGTLQLLNGANISSSTHGAGPGGKVEIQADVLRLVGQNNQQGSAISATSDGQSAGGIGGDISITADRTSLTDGAVFTTQTSGPNPAGSITVKGAVLHLSNQSLVDSSSSGSGPAGTLTLDLTGDLTLHLGGITTGAPQSSGGNITIHVDRNFALHNSAISAEASGEGGSVNILCSGILDVRNSTILTQAGDNGGNISVDPPRVVLENSRLSANGGSNGGNITLVADGLLQSSTTITATGSTGINGNVTLTPPDTQLAGSLAVLPAELTAPNARLAPACGLMLNTSDISSFIVTGKGGESPQPGGWNTDWSLDLRPSTRP